MYQLRSAYKSMVNEEIDVQVVKRIHDDLTSFIENNLVDLDHDQIKIVRRTLRALKNVNLKEPDLIEMLLDVADYFDREEYGEEIGRILSILINN